MPIIDVLINLNRIAHKHLVSKSIKDIYIKSVQLSIRDANLLVSISSKAAVINSFQYAGEHFQPYLVIFDEAAQATLP